MLPSFLSQKFRFWAFASMLLLVFVHGYNLTDRYLQPFSLVREPLTFTSFFEYFTANGIFRFRIPMLFAISGYLFALGDTKPYQERIQSRVRTLLLPYVLWSALGLLLTWGLEQWSLSVESVRAAHLSEPIAMYQWYDVLFRLIMNPLPFQLWFIRVLFVYNAAYPLLLRAVTNAPKVWFSIIAFIWLTMPIGLGFAEPEGLLFFTLGMWLQKNNFNLETPPKWLNVKVWSGAWILLAALKTAVVFFAPPSPAVFIGLIVGHRIVEGLGIGVAWFGMDALVRWYMGQQWFKWSSSFSFIIYALHVPMVNYLLHPAFQMWSGLPMYRLVLYGALPLAVIGVCISVGAVLRRILPQAYGVLTGGRGLQ